MENNKRKFVLFKIHMCIYTINEKNHLLTTENSFLKTQIGQNNVT